MGQSLERRSRFDTITKMEPYQAYVVIITNCRARGMIGDFRKHLSVAREKLEALTTAYENKHHTVVGDLGTTVLEQLIEQDAARKNPHFGGRVDRHAYAEKELDSETNHAMKRIWFG